MDMNNKKLWAVAGALALALPIAGFAAVKQWAPSAVNCEANGCNITVNVPPAQIEEALGASAPQDFTNLTALALSGDLSVAGTSTFTGTTTFNGQVQGVPKLLQTTISTSATTTAAALLNSTGADRVIVAAWVSDTGTAASVGSVTWQAGTTTASGAAVPAASRAINTAVTRVSGLAVITTTSTPQLTAYMQWRSGEYFQALSSTTTNAGTLNLLYY